MDWSPSELVFSATTLKVSPLGEKHATSCSNKKTRHLSLLNHPEKQSYSQNINKQNLDAFLSQSLLRSHTRKTHLSHLVGESKHARVRSRSSPRSGSKCLLRDRRHGSLLRGGLGVRRRVTGAVRRSVRTSVRHRGAVRAIRSAVAHRGAVGRGAV